MAACSASSPKATLIRYHRSGGIAGLDESLEIQTDGAAVLTTKTGRSEFQLDEETLSGLKKLFEDQRFSQLDRAYLPKSSADMISYEVTYAGKQVRTADTMIPEALAPIIDELNRITIEGGKK